MAEDSAADVARHRRAKSPRPHHVSEVDALSAESGRLTAAALADLPDSTWTVVHDIQWPGRQHRNIDHVVVGPAGVFVVETLDWRGIVNVWESTLYHDGQAQKREVKEALEAAAAIAVLTPGVPPHAVWPVLCLGRNDELKGKAGRVLVCSASTLAEVLGLQVHALSSEQRRVAVKQLEERLHSRSAVKVASKVAHTNEKRTARLQRRAKPGKVPEQHSSVTPYKPPRNGSLVPVLLIIGAAILFIGFPDVVLGAADAVREAFQGGGN